MLRRLVPAAALLAFATPAVAQTSVVVPSNRTIDTIVGSVTAGQSYTVGISGNSILCITCNGGGALTFVSNGRPTSPLNSPYTGFGPAGRNEDPSTSGIDYGAAGANFNLGALVFVLANGTAPLGQSFSLQNGATFTAAATGTLNAIINDTNYGDNGAGGFTVTFAAAAVPTSPGAVPEPASWAMMIGGFGVAGGALRRRRRTAKVAFA